MYLAMKSLATYFTSCIGYYGTAQLQGNECSHVTREFHMCHLQVSCISLTSFMCVTFEYQACHSLVTKLHVRSITVYFYSSFSLQATSELEGVS